MILSCEHHTGMGLCSACSAEVSAQSREHEAFSTKYRKLTQLIKSLEEQGDYTTAEKYRKKRDKL